MKISNLIALYLYDNRTLNLPGIGIFTLDPSVAIPQAGDKHFEEFFQHIKFQEKNISAPDESLIDYIREHTGKIRPLAVSDLETFIEDGKILLNLDKPFHLEGIGDIIKNKDGELDFIAGSLKPVRVENYFDHIPETPQERVISSGTTEGGNRKLMISLAVIVGILAVIAGGYYFFQQSRGPADLQTNNNNAVTGTETGITTDSTRLPSDSATVPATSGEPAVTGFSDNTYKFIIETTPRRNRAFTRYEQLKSYFLDIRMDSVTESGKYKLYFLIDAASKDTAYIKDSLANWYNSRGVIIEKP